MEVDGLKGVRLGLGVSDRVRPQNQCYVEDSTDPLLPVNFL